MSRISCSRIVRLLFEPIQPNERLEPPRIAVLLDDSKAAEADKWPLNPIAVVDDIPFMVGQGLMGGMPEHPETHVKWSRHSGILRKKPLMPTADPLVAAETLFNDQRFLAVDDFARKEAVRMVRLQATAMAGLATRDATERLTSIDDGRWEASVAESARRKISWDADRERFTLKRR